MASHQPVGCTWVFATCSCYVGDVPLFPLGFPDAGYNAGNNS